MEQEAAISICETRKDAAVQTIEAHNQLVSALAERLAPKRPWWRLRR